MCLLWLLWLLLLLLWLLVVVVVVERRRRVRHGHGVDDAAVIRADEDGRDGVRSPVERRRLFRTRPFSPSASSSSFG